MKKLTYFYILLSFNISLHSQSNISDQFSLPIDFENGFDFEGYVFADFDGATTTVVENPQVDLNNSSIYVGRQYRIDGQWFGGSTILLSDTLDFAYNNTFRMKVLSNRNDVPIQLKLEGENGQIDFVQVTRTNSLANTWENIDFYFGEQSSSKYIKITMIFDIGSYGDGTDSSTFYFDDIEFIYTQPNINDFPINFDDQDINYQFLDFQGTYTTILPDKDNQFNNVARTTKGNGAVNWAGTVIGTNGYLLGDSIPFSENNTKMHMRIKIPSSFIVAKIKLKVENGSNSNIYVETDAYAISGGQWEVIEFDFNNVSIDDESQTTLDLSNNYNKIIIFFDFDNEGNEDYFYWDDLSFGEIPPDFNLNNNNNNNNLTIYPNPSSDYIMIEGRLNHKLKFYNTDGNLVKEHNDKLNKIDIKDLKPGLYYLKIIDNGNTLIKKFIKN